MWFGEFGGVGSCLRFSVPMLHFMCLPLLVMYSGRDVLGRLSSLCDCCDCVLLVPSVGVLWVTS